RKHLRRGYVIHRIGREEQQRPSSAHARTRQDSVAVVPLEPHSRAQQQSADCISHQDLARRSECLELVSEKEGHSEHQNRDAQLVQPVGAKSFFEIKRRLDVLCQGGRELAGGPRRGRSNGSRTGRGNQRRRGRRLLNRIWTERGPGCKLRWTLRSSRWGRRQLRNRRFFCDWDWPE